MKKSLSVFFAAVFIIALTFTGQSQISQGGQPYSIQHASKGELTKQVPIEVMPYVNVDVLRAEDKVLDNHKDIPWRFGQNIEVSFNRKTNGIEETLPNGDKIWRLCIASPGAVSINLLFDNYYVPKGAKMYIYNADHTDMIGAFTDFNNRDDRMFATTLVKGDFMTIEYYEPADAEFEGEINLMRVTHGYRGPEDFIDKAFGSSGSCNVNVICPQSAGMEDQIRSVCMLVSGSSGFCTGALINNTSNDGTPYVLSADHCYTTPGSVIYWFNWESTTCVNGTNPPHDDISGATQCARNAASDFWLVELSSDPPAGYNVYFSGWNRTTDNNISGKVWGIHHPAGDIKKISWSTLGVSTTTYLQEPVPGDGTHWRITTWSDGTTTEGGSSGSPLFDPTGHIIGQLHGGYASCSSITSDWYGKLGVSWTGGGSNTTRLSNWLDPGSTGATVIEGYDPNTPSVALDAQMISIVAPLDAYCSIPTITPEVTIRNSGTTTLTSATVSYVLNGGSPVVTTWSGSLTTGQTANITFPSITLIAGSGQTFAATVTNPNGGTDQNTANDSQNKIFSVTSDFVAPFTEGFEGATFPPACWSQETVSGSVMWAKNTGGYNNTNPTTAHTGTSNAYFYHNSYSGYATKLITPPINIQGLANPRVTFWHTQAVWSGDQDELRIYYKTTSGGTWNLLQTYTASITTWTERTITLPNPSTTYYVAFQGTADYGYGVCVDDVLITGDNVDVQELEAHHVFVYPNPSNGQFGIVFSENAAAYDGFTVTDMEGRTVYSQDIEANTSQLNIDLTHLASGAYMIHFYNAESKVIKKIIIQ